MAQQYNPSIGIFRSLFFSCLIIFLFSCGGGGKENTSSEPKKIETLKIEYLPLSAQKSTYSEGEEVSLSLEVKGASGVQLVYKWKVSQGGENISFAGQNTDSVRFTAPLVDGDKSIFVSVSVEREDGILLGLSHDSTTIFIKDLNPNNQHLVSGDAFKQDLPEVDSLALEGLDSQVTWLQTDYHMVPTLVENSEVLINYAVRSIAYSDQDEVGDYRLRSCSSRVDSPFDNVLSNSLSFMPSLLFGVDNKFYHSDCEDLNDQDVRYFGDHSEFTVEYYCKNTLVSAKNFRKLASSHLTSLADVSLSIESHGDIRLTENVCVQTIRTLASQDDLSLSTGVVDVSAQYEQEDFRLRVSLKDDLRGPTFHFMNDFFGEDLSWAEITTPSLVLLGDNRINDGNIRVDTADEQGNMSLELDLDYLDDERNSQSIKGTITFDINN